MVKSTRLYFELKISSDKGPRAGLDIFGQFYPNGKTVLNKSEWRGKEPRSCGVTRLKSRPHKVTDNNPVIVDVEVSYRPKGYISYVGTTKYDGWTAMKLNKSSEGTLLDREGRPLKDGEQPIYQPVEVFQDIEFNELDFGTFVGEFDVEDVKRATIDEVMAELNASNSFGDSSFVAAHRNRPFKKIILSNAPTNEFVDDFGTRVININNSIDHLEQMLMDRLESLMCEFVEGKASIKNIGNDAMAYVELSDSLVDCTPNEVGFDSWFDVLRFYTPIDFLEHLAKRLMSVYDINVSVIDGKGLVLRHGTKKS